jgi:hypothetical protein
MYVYKYVRIFIYIHTHMSIFKYVGMNIITCKYKYIYVGTFLSLPLLGGDFDVEGD